MPLTSTPARDSMTVKTPEPEDVFFLVRIRAYAGCGGPVNPCQAVRARRVRVDGNQLWTSPVVFSALVEVVH